MLKLKEVEYPGLFITFCGLDGAGKTTLIHRLVEYMDELKLPKFLTRQPTELVRKSTIFRNFQENIDHSDFDYRSLSLLAASDRLQHSNQCILPELQKGNVVVSDRYFYSCLANLRARGFDKDKWIYEIARYIPKPDLAFFLDIDWQTAAKRVISRPEEKDKWFDTLLQQRLREEYLRIAKSCGGIIIHSNRDEEEVFDEVKSYFDKLLFKKNKVSHT